MAKGKSAKELHALMKRFDIRLLQTASKVEAQGILALRPGATVLRSDDYIVATAKHYGIRFASGDVRAVKSAILAGVDTRYAFFKPGVSRSDALRNFLNRMSADKRVTSLVNPLDIWYPNNPW